MDPVSILGVAAATIQFVDFGQRLFSETWQIYRSASGQTLQLQNLSAISKDITQLSTSVKESFEAQTNGLFALKGPDKELFRLCRECDDIATQILTVIPKVGGQFEKDLATDKSVGDCFRAALKSWWKRDEITKIGERLEKVSQDIMKVAIISIWTNSQSTKNWEHQFSSKLDNLIEMLSRSLETAGCSGPEQTQSYKQNAVQESATISIRRNNVTDKITNRLWQPDWKPDPQLLASFPEQTELSIEEINSSICESLRFDSMDNREEAITKTFDCTFQWIFDRNPKPSPEGAAMWSSFPDWLEGNSGLPYWITGKPGSGKSTMMKFILQHPALSQHLEKWSQGSPFYMIRYYAWKPGSEMARSEDGLLRTLLHQILHADPKLTPYLCPRRWSLIHAVRDIDALPLWTMWELEESFGRLLQLEDDKPLLALFIDGLDEFDVAPVDLCKRIQLISSHNSFKVCTTSRPWPQFSDAFSSSPGLQMHLLTDADIQDFVHGHFRGVIAFQELDNLYGGGGEALLADIVRKAKGVFLWTSLVTQTLLENLIDGSGLAHLQEVLDAMPSEIESLYDAIYAAIPKSLLPEVSVMLQLYVLAFQPVDWMTLWLADEARGNPIDTQVLIQYPEKERVQATLRRRLGARTRGILEIVPQTRTVEYLHRTAAEWANSPRIWEQIRSVSPRNFDPFACLLRAGVSQTQNSTGNPEVDRRLVKALHYASHIDERIIPDASVVTLLEQFFDALMGFPTGHSSTLANYTFSRYNAAGKASSKANTFNGMATQFAVLSFIRHKLHQDLELFYPVPAKRSIALLEQAIFGPRVFLREDLFKILDQPSVPRLSDSQRLRVVEFLLQKGLRQPGILSLVKAYRSTSTDVYDHKYLDAVAELLKRYRATSGEKKIFVKRLLGLK